MATITRATQNWYRGNVAYQANQAQTFIENQVRNSIEKQLITGNSINVAQLRNETIDNVNTAANVFGNNSKAISNEFFDYTMQLQNSDLQAEMLENEYNEEWIDEQIRYLAQLVVEGNTEAFIAECGEYINYLVWKSAFDNSWKNAARYGVRFARVPSGNKTCAFCMMLASRGFVYRSEESAGGGFFSYHKKCDCEIISNVEGSGLKIDGYDLDQLRGVYYEARKNAEKGFDYSQGSKALEGRILEEIRKIIKDPTRNI